MPRRNGNQVNTYTIEMPVPGDGLPFAVGSFTMRAVEGTALDVLLGALCEEQPVRNQLALGMGYLPPQSGRGITLAPDGTLEFSSPDTGDK